MRERFEELQAALKAGDADKLWALLDPKSQADAEAAAKSAHTAYAAASPEEQAKMQKDLGLSGPELLALSGKTYLKTERFRGKFHEVPESKIDKVTVQGDTATVNYIESDGDKVKLNLVKQGGQWKVTLPMPPATQP